jgi:hypothetical protein
MWNYISAHDSPMSDRALWFEGSQTVSAYLAEESSINKTYEAGCGLSVEL